MINWSHVAISIVTMFLAVDYVLLETVDLIPIWFVIIASISIANWSGRDVKERLDGKAVKK